ncbi:MAG TPA: response regulator [Tepidisphaeraceae bacterium]|jgi:CheY-like chemotaxis protein
MSQILIVDDDADVCQLMVKLLKRFGYQAGCVNSGRDCLHTLATDPPNLVLLDMMMPEMSGMDVLKHLRAEGKPLPVPIIVFSALSDVDVKKQALSLGACDYWVKASMDIHDIMARLARFLPQDPGAPAVH